MKKTGSNETETYFTDDHESFTVTISPNCILTIFSDNETTTKKWITQVQKTYHNKKKKTQPLIVGVQVSSELNYTKKSFSLELQDCTDLALKGIVECKNFADIEVG
ncbi:hypothetical protein IFM89_002162 [Coptis chinensis]|uniref:PH domain-containing protein n=1 Tax=Coptis chinensis TaxID=261450 RepID=A0A835M6J9_9MAGN|nr:hypothetical protein IFM89_002162 [Coptis chinensis]